MSSTETPTQTVARAAKLMRERAEAAPHGPWHVEPLGDKGYPQSISNAAATVIGETYTNPAYPPMNANYIASMHPIVALAVAAFLESWGDIEVSEYGPHTDDWKHALTIARAYLGEAS